MRPVFLGCSFLLPVIAVLVAACSRNPLASEAAGASGARARGPTPTAAPVLLSAPLETGSAKLRLATALGDTTDAGATEALPATPPAPLTGKTILHVGDSMVGGNQGLTRALEQRFTAEGAKLIRDYKVSESIVSYDHSPKLKSLVEKNRPDIVIITLGTNDVFVPYPASMAGNVRNIVKRVGATECYWMGPPTWKPDTGIVQVLKDNVAPCKFFDSSNLKLQRSGDGIHPTDRGGAEWATSFWTYFRALPSASTAVRAGAGLAP
jgi:lysophospholipase L1-like esterase